MKTEHHDRVTFRIEQVLRTTFALPASHQACHFTLCLLDCYTRFQSTDHREEVPTTIPRVCRIELEWKKNFNLIVAPRRKGEVKWHYSDHSGRFRVDQNLFADDVARATESPLP